jgi:hypothetical protein
MPPDAPQLEADRDQITRSTNGKYLGKTRLISRSQLDHRTKAAQEFDQIASAIASDLGGEDRLSTVQKHLVEAFAGAAIHVNDLNARLLLGQEVDILEHSQAISTMVRIASRIGVHRLAKDISPLAVDDYIEQSEPEPAS